MTEAVAYNSLNISPLAFDRDASFLSYAQSKMLFLTLSEVQWNISFGF